MLLAYAQEQRSPWWVLVFAVACAASSVYSWLAGSPFGVVEGVWALGHSAAGCSVTRPFQRDPPVPRSRRSLLMVSERSSPSTGESEEEW